MRQRVITCAHRNLLINSRNDNLEVCQGRKPLYFLAVYNDMDYHNFLGDILWKKKFR